MDLTVVETFYWAATLMSITNAARRLHIVPQAASARIRTLETELGVVLVDRSGRGGFRLTAAGENFLGDAERLLRVWREVRSTYPAQLEAPFSLRMGTIESALQAWVIPWIKSLPPHHPHLTFQLTTETSQALYQLIEHGRLDLVVSAEATYEIGVHSRQLPSMPMAFVGHRNLHTQSSYTLAELAEFQLLTFQRGSQPFIKLRELLARHGLEATQVHAISSASAMLQLIAGGLGVAALPAATVDSVAREQGFIELRCDAQLAELPLYMSWRTDPADEALDSIAQSLSAFISQRLDSGNLLPAGMVATSDYPSVGVVDKQEAVDEQVH